MRLRDVGWGDALFAFPLAMLVAFPPWAVAYLLVVYVGDFSVDDQSLLTDVAFVLICFIEGLVLTRLYEGRGGAIEHGWAWLVVGCAMALFSLAIYVTGLVSSESALAIALGLFGLLSSMFLVVAMALYLSARTRRKDVLEDRRTAQEREAALTLLRR